MTTKKLITHKLNILSNSNIVNKNRVIICVLITGLFGCTTVDRVVDAHISVADRVLDIVDGK